jgi:hypothetical protein
MSAIDTLLEMDDGNEYRQAGNGEPWNTCAGCSGKQVGFSTPVELAGSFSASDRVAGGTMELTLPPRPHETVENRPVHAWRVAGWRALGISRRWPSAPRHVAPDGGAGGGAALRGSHSRISADTAQRLK